MKDAINGNQIAADIINRLKNQPKQLKILAAVIFGKNKISLDFLTRKEKIAKELNVDFRLYEFPEDLTNDLARKEVRILAEKKPVGGLIIQLPLPPQINRHYVLNIIPREKDIDVLGERALGAFYAGRNPVLPPAVGAIEEISMTRGLQLDGLKVAMVGLGFLIGKPIANWLMGKAGEIYLLNQSSDLNILKQADLVISGVGKAGLIKPDMLKNNAGVIDFGYSYDANKKIRGDFDVSQLSNFKNQLSFYTPTPGGAGPITIAKLFENFYKLNSKPQSKKNLTFLN